MGVLSPVIAPALRGRDPYPEAILALDFAGVRTGGRQFYKRDGIIVPRFEMLRGAASVGHAGFGTTPVNGVYRPFAPDAPLIGDGGLLVPEAKTELVGLSCRPANALWATEGATKTPGPTYKGIYQSAKSSSNGATWHRLRMPVGTTVTSGQTYTVVARYRGGTSGRVRIELVRSIPNQFTTVTGVIGSSLSVVYAAGGAGVASVVETVDEGDGIYRTVLAWTPDFTGLINSTGIGPNSAVAGEDIEVLGLSIQAGAYVNNPPIDNGNLPATRTAVAQSVGGLNLTPPYVLLADYSSILLPSGTLGSVAILGVDDGTVNNRVMLRFNPMTGALQRTVVNAGAVLIDELEVNPRSPVGVKAGLRVASDGKVTVAAQGSVALAASAAVAIPSTSRVTLGHGPGSLFLNGLLSRARVRLGDMSDAEFAGLTA